MGVDETLLNEVVRRILTVARPDRIILFGSAATGQMTKDSDIDLLVMESAPANTHERRVRCPGRYRIPGGRHRDADGTFRTNEALDRRHCVPG
jgi:hypothetical protein